MVVFSLGIRSMHRVGALVPAVLTVAVLLATATTGQILDNRDTCAHRVVNCDPSVDHFATKISMEHSSSVQRLEYKNTHILLEQSWPTRGPWMKNTTQVRVCLYCCCSVVYSCMAVWKLCQPACCFCC